MTLLMHGRDFVFQIEEYLGLKPDADHFFIERVIREKLAEWEPLAHDDSPMPPQVRELGQNTYRCLALVKDVLLNEDRRKAYQDFRIAHPDRIFPIVNHSLEQSYQAVADKKISRLIFADLDTLRALQRDGALEECISALGASAVEQFNQRPKLPPHQYRLAAANQSALKVKLFRISEALTLAIDSIYRAVGVEGALNELKIRHFDDALTFSGANQELMSVEKKLPGLIQAEVNKEQDLLAIGWNRVAAIAGPQTSSMPVSGEADAKRTAAELTETVKKHTRSRVRELMGMRRTVLQELLQLAKTERLDVTKPSKKKAPRPVHVHLYGWFGKGREAAQQIYVSRRYIPSENGTYKMATSDEFRRLFLQKTLEEAQAVYAGNGPDMPNADVYIFEKSEITPGEPNEAVDHVLRKYGYRGESKSRAGNKS